MVQNNILSPVANTQQLLPSPGPTRLSKDDVKAAHRFRLLNAMAKKVAQEGYLNTSVGDVIACAQVSRRTFYEIYANKEECFIDLIKFGGDALTAYLKSTIDSNRPSEETLSLIIKNYLELLASERNFAKCILVEAFAAGKVAVDLRYQITENIAQLMTGMYTKAKHLTESEIKQNPDIELVTLAISSIVTKTVAKEQYDQLPLLHSKIMNFVYSNIGLN